MREAVRVHRFVRDFIRYTRDVRGVETLHTAPQILQQRQGDCDDKAVLIASMLESIGHETRFIAVGYGGKFRHVYPEAKVRGKWVGLEATENWPAGRVAKMPMRMVQEI